MRSTSAPAGSRWRLTSAAWRYASVSPGSISHDWADSVASIDIHPGTCVADDYGAPAGTSAVRRAGAGAPGETFTVPPGASSYAVAVAGNGGRPQVALLDPAGQTVVFGDPRNRATKAMNIPGTPASNTTYVGLVHPKAGTYTLVPVTGSPAIAGLRVSRGYPTPKVTATLGGRGRKRTLRYRVSGNAPGTSIVFVERGPAGDVPIGTAKGATGTLHFTSGKGPGGRRGILAEATRTGLAFTSPEVAHYTAPPIPRPGAVGHLRASHTRGTLSVRFTGAPGAKSYTVKVLLSDGRGLQRRLNASQHRVLIPNVGKGVHARVTVTSVGPDGRLGPARRASLG